MMYDYLSDSHDSLTRDTELGLNFTCGYISFSTKLILQQQGIGNLVNSTMTSMTLIYLSRSSRNLNIPRVTDWMVLNARAVSTSEEFSYILYTT